MTHWLVPANTKFYDVFAAFEQPHTYWPMNGKFAPRDIAYIYLAAPHKQIGFVCEVLEIGFDLDKIIDHVRPFIKGEVDGNSPQKPFMKLKAIQTLALEADSPLALGHLKQNGLNGMLMGVRKLENNPPLFSYIEGNLS
ncbi:MAG: hypothetical protein JKY99_01830 [Rhizobiales bacterium]|nr:hypothetical protein [Hyphomicrobiales bacterium]